MKSIPPEESLIEYPSIFPIKVMGVGHAELEQTLVLIVQRHDPDFDVGTLEKRPSRSGNYVGLTFPVNATSREQLDALYRELHAHPLVKIIL